MQYTKIINPSDLKDFLDISKKYGGGIPLSRILSILSGANSKCKTIIIEEEYLDKEYEEEYKVFYYKVFASSPPSKCIRLHFFSSKFSKINSYNIKKNEAKYQGYCTIRPKPLLTISDAFISENIVIDINSRFVFMSCNIEKKVSLIGIQLKVRGFPFIQQDGRIGVCAQAALKMVADHGFETKIIGNSYTAPKITELAKKSPHPNGARHIPSSGLDDFQIQFALEEMGFEPLIYDRSDRSCEKKIEHPEQIIYRYLESGIPVIVGIQAGDEKHAIVVIGHTFNPDYWFAKAGTIYPDLRTRSLNYQCSTNWIQNFIVQDDNIGPYCFVPIDFLSGSITKCIIVPLYEDVFLAGEKAESNAYKLMTRKTFLEKNVKVIYNALKKNNSKSETLYWLNLFLECIHKKRIILRTYLRDKGLFIEQDIKNYDKSIQTMYKTINLPQKIWVVEISMPEIFCYARKKCGEILFASTGGDEINHSYITFHFPGAIMIHDITANKTKYYIIDAEDKPVQNLYKNKFCFSTPT